MPTAAPPLQPPMSVLQNRWYNGLANQLGLDRASFQISQPAPPITATDQGLWSYQNVIPPASLTFNRNLPNDSFFDPYAAVVQQLECPTQLETAVGPVVYAQWVAYLSTLSPPPPDSELPAIFMQWANANGHQDVARQGASALIAINLFNGQKNAVLPYEGAHAKPVDFQGGYGDLVKSLGKTGSRNLTMDSSTTSADVSQTWTGGQSFGLQGLWSGSGPNSRLSRIFAASQVTVNLGLARFLLWMSTPGGWYSSSLLNTAYSSTATPPWPRDADPTWDEAFGTNGTLSYFIASLLVGDGLTATVTSDAVYGKLDQQTIQENAAAGFWPFYTPTRGTTVTNTVTNTVSFDPKTKNMTIQTVAQSQNPFVVGANVLTTARYLGH